MMDVLGKGNSQIINGYALPRKPGVQNTIAMPPRLYMFFPDMFSV